MKIGDYVYTPRFCTVKINVVFETVPKEHERVMKQ